MLASMIVMKMMQLSLHIVFWRGALFGPDFQVQGGIVRLSDG